MPERTRRLYDLAIWRKKPGGLRWRALIRDGFECRRCGFLDITGRKLDVDHIVPHDGDFGRFTDFDNLQTLCKECHAGEKQAEDKSGGGWQRDADGWLIPKR